MNIALFGTSADPPSIGHQQILQWLDKHYDRVWVWVSDNPFKTHQASLSDRLKMMELTIVAIQPPTQAIAMYPEISNPRTIHTVEQAKLLMPSASFSLVIGGDLVAQLPTWYRAQDLLRQVNLLVVPRQGVVIATADIERLVNMGTDVAIAPESISIPDVSSSDYRNNGNNSVIIPTVAAYIQQESLYAWPKKSRPIAQRPLKPLADFKVGVDNVIFSVDTEQNRLLVLLVMRQHEPYRDRWCLPGTLVRQGESLEESAYRILSEKIRAKNLYLEQLFTFGDIGRDPREAPDSYAVRYLSVSYFALVPFSQAELIADGVSGIAWYPVKQVPELAFDHNRILEYGHRRLCNKLEYSPVAFDVLPESFTLSDLYQLYTSVLGENFADYSNFRTRLLKLGFLSDTGIKTSRGAGRPASLYRFDAEAFAPFKNKPMVFI